MDTRPTLSTSSLRQILSLSMRPDPGNPSSSSRRTPYLHCTPSSSAAPSRRPAYRRALLQERAGPIYARIPPPNVRMLLGPAAQRTLRLVVAEDDEHLGSEPWCAPFRPWRRDTCGAECATRTPPTHPATAPNPHLCTLPFVPEVRMRGSLPRVASILEASGDTGRN
jgi:hypothetical protein